jgi:hypothetical protein
MNKYELSLLNDRIRNSLSLLRNFLDSTSSVEIEIRESIGTLKVCAKKNKHHEAKTLLVFLDENCINETLQFIDACLFAANKTVICEIKDFNKNSELRDFLRHGDFFELCIVDGAIIIKNSLLHYVVVEKKDITRCGIEILTRSMTLFIAACGKNVTSSIDCFELNDYGISKIKNDVDINEITKGEYESDRKVSSRNYL